MKICITCVYWTLLFISVASSALLFIIVASENAQNNYYSSSKINETFEIYDNDTMNNIESDDLDVATIPITKLHDIRKLETNYKDHYYQEKYAEESTTFETVINGQTRKKGNSYKDSDIVTESLTKQPNLSQGVSENEQATVLTLVDTTAAELQSLAEPQLNPEFSRTTLFPNNSSLLTKNTNIGQQAKKEQEKISPNIQTPSPSIVHEITERPNETSILGEESLSLTNSVEEEEKPEIVVVVRAEQASIPTDEPELKLEDSVVKVFSDEIPKIDTIFTTPELSDSNAKAQLVGDNRDEAAAVVLSEGIVSVGSTNPHEDIPSFSEWTQKRLEEAERKKTHPNASIQNSGAPTRGIGGMKVRSKNYASPDCGAKIVAANPEAQSVRSVLVSTRDEYMLNTCTSRIWFVVELCEAIQAKKIELANFELFSSSPKDFLVYISDRFPTRDWSPVGQFTAKDVKDIQSFVLQPHLFGKFIKIELQTYYGSEHFCPISLFRAYGTSEFEVLETETENQVSRETHSDVDDEEDSDEEEVLDVENGEPPRNLFGSARDAVLSIMKKAAEVLVKSSDLTYNNITKIQQSIDNGNILENSFVSCTTPRYIILCDNCSDKKFAKIFQLISCKEKQLNELLKIDFVNRSLRQNGLCKIHGVGVETFTRKETKEEYDNMKNTENHNQLVEKCVSNNTFELTFITSILKSEYIAALCNVLAIKERKTVMNTSHEISFSTLKEVIKEDTSTKYKEDYSTDTIKSFHHTSTTPTSSSNDDMPHGELKKDNEELSSEEASKVTSTPQISSNSKSTTAQIKSIETFEEEELKNETIPILESIKSNDEETIQAEVQTTVPLSLNVEQHTISKSSEEPCITSSTFIENLPQTTISVPITTTNNNELPSEDISDVESLELPSVSNKVVKVEYMDQEGKSVQTEILDQEIKLPSQDSLTFDNLLSDLKDLEGETAHIQNGPANPSVTQSTPNTTPQKESVFLRLSNRIKVLERNMSLSGQYLEELSRRYKKQVEEMQRSLERTVSAMSEETRKRDERELKRAEEIAILKEKIVNLSKSVKNLLYDRDSWRGKIFTIGQHILLLCSEIFVIYLILVYCSRNNNKRTEVKEKQQLGKDMIRRKSAENYSSHTKKVNKRRPSEIAAHITGTYRELMIADKSYETKREKKKKRKKATTLTSNQANVNNDTGIYPITQYKTSTNVADELEITPKVTSSIEALHTIDSQKQACKKRKSTPENTINWFNDNVHEAKCNIQLMLSCADDYETDNIKITELNSTCIENLNDSDSLSADGFQEKIAYNQQTAESEDLLNSTNISTILKDTGLNVKSPFVKTALSTRKKRIVYSNDMNGQWNQDSADFNDKTVQVSSTSTKLSTEKMYADGDTSTNGLLSDQSDESRSSSVTSMSKRKEGKCTGFRQMVRKFF